MSFRQFDTTKIGRGESAMSQNSGGVGEIRLPMRSMKRNRLAAVRRSKRSWPVRERRFWRSLEKLVRSRRPAPQAQALVKKWQAYLPPITTTAPGKFSPALARCMWAMSGSCRTLTGTARERPRLWPRRSQPIPAEAGRGSPSGLSKRFTRSSLLSLLSKCTNIARKFLACSAAVSAQYP